jgi:radical SAM family protein/B12 binding protein
MGEGSKRVLLLYGDRYYLIRQVFPFGLGLIADFLRRNGHEVSIRSPFLPDPDAEKNLAEIIGTFRPDVIGLGIRNLDTCMSCETFGDHGGENYRTFYFLPEVKRIAGLIKRHAPGIPVIAGGGAFTISPRAILEYLEIEYGVIGEGEEAMLRFADAFPDGDRISEIPNLVTLRGEYSVNPRQKYRLRQGSRPLQRGRGFSYGLETMGLPVQVKRGCNRNCSYCVEPIIEGRQFLFRDVDAVIEDMRAAAQDHEGVNSIFFVDTEFNVPDLAYSTRLVKRIIEEDLHSRFSFSSQFLPRPFDTGFAELLFEAGFSVILTCDSFSDEVLTENRAPYGEKDVIRTIENCEEFGINCTLSMVFGLPGETWDTVDHSIEQMKRYGPGFTRRYEYTMGGRIYMGTGLCRMVERGGQESHLYGIRSDGYLAPYYFCSPENPMKLKQYIEAALGYPIAYDNRYDETSFRALALADLTDRGRHGDAIALFLKSDLGARSSIYPYLFRKLTEAGRPEDARTISQDFLDAIQGEGEDSPYRDQSDLVKFYLGCLR